MSIRKEGLKIGRDRVRKLFQYLEALSHVRNPVEHDVTQGLWHLWLEDLPQHSSLGREESITDDFQIRLRKPSAASPSPKPPESIASWLDQGWDDPIQEARVRKAQVRKSDKGQVAIVPFDSDTSRVADFKNWSRNRSAWSSIEGQAERARQLFARLYTLYEQLERESDKLELVLGDGVLSSPGTDGQILHPLLLQKVRLEYDPVVPEFSISLFDSHVELHSAVLHALPGVNGRALAEIRKDLEAARVASLGQENSSALLRRMAGRISAHTEFRSGKIAGTAEKHPIVAQAPILFLRRRGAGSALALRSVLADLNRNRPIPSSLLRIVGIDDRDTAEKTADMTPHWMEDIQPTSILLSKAANARQIQVARRLEDHGSVLVQGPPGTGKTHTIANLIGHLLAEEKTVLVTSHASKALRVVRDQVVPELRHLCASLLDSDAESQTQLGHSIEAIVTRLSFDSAAQLEKESQELEQQRQGLLAQLRFSLEQILIARADEYQGIAIGETIYAPSDAAKLVRSGAGLLEHIPEPVTQGCAIPLSDAELKELYKTNKLVSMEDEADCREPLPDLQRLISAKDFLLLVTDQRKLVGKNLFRSELWKVPPHPDHLPTLNTLRQQALATAEKISKAEPWQLALMNAGRQSSKDKRNWEELFALAESTWQFSSSVRMQLDQHQPKLPDNLSPEECSAAAEGIVGHLEEKGELSFLVLLTRPKWKALLQEARVESGKPKLASEFTALRSSAELTQLRKKLGALWSSQVSNLNVPGADLPEQAPEEFCYRLVSVFRPFFDWNDSEWRPLQAALNASGLQLQQLLSEQTASLTEVESLLALAQLLAGPLQEILTSRCVSAALEHIKAELASTQAYLRTVGASETGTGIGSVILDAVATGNSKAYSKAMGRLEALIEKRHELGRREELLTKLGKKAPGWASAIRNREGVHGTATCPPKLKEAWLWRQLHDALKLRSQGSLDDMDGHLARIQLSIRQVTAALIEKRAWAAQIRRTEDNHRQKQALVGWLDTVRKIGKGTGVRAPKLKAQANRLMTECRSAVPVWIMPLARAAENFDPGSMKFDVVIVDEASQSDAMGLLALYYADKAIVVGDHEQVSPSAVGQELNTVQHLIDEHLEGVPNAHLYDGQTSLYDLARASFGGTIRLVEHFRCVPKIIEFSNQLSYEGAILPLRDASKVALTPSVVAHRVVDSAVSENKVNDEEALEIAALIIAASEQPEYEKKSIGVISLVGDEQAKHIDEVIRKHKSQYDFDTKHNLLCGTPAQFQGDERDVIFLSLVDTSDGDLLALREQTMFKQRFNVAASRAKDQMWVIHSMDRSDLQANDLRRKLIEHAEEAAHFQSSSALLVQPQSTLEGEIVTNLVGAGYLVTPQWKVGAHHIDLVVEGDGKRVAVECDGDKDYTFEELQDDLLRQTTLARLGWTFVHVQGSRYYLDPEGTLNSLVEKLSALGIEPTTSLSANNAAMEPCELLDRVKARARELRNEWLGATASKVARSKKVRAVEFHCATTS